MFASEFLAPAREIAELLPSTVDWKQLMRLKETWGISMQALLYRARSLKIMPEYTYRRAVTELNRRGWRRAEPGDDGRAEEPIILRRAIEMMAEKGRTLTDLSNESRLPIDTIEMIAPPDERPTVDLSSF
jgi:Zn-dependent peptidase ImmA (M78 family)